MSARDRRLPLAGRAPRSLLGLLLLVVLAACRGAPAAQPQPTLTDPPATVAASPTTAPTPSPAPATSPPPTSAPAASPSPAGPAPAIDRTTAAQLQPMQALTFAPWELVTALAASPDGVWLAAAAGENIVLVRTADWQPVATFRVVALTHGLAFSPDSLWLAAASRDGYLRVWQTAGFATGDNAPPGLRVEAHRKGANTVTFAPQFGQAAGRDGWLLASGGNDAMARFWDLSSGENIGMMVGGTFAVPSIAFLPDGAQLVVTNGDRIRLREVGSERITGTFAADAPLYSLAVSPDGRRVAAGGSDNRVRLYDPATAYRTGQEQYPDPVALAGHTGRLNTYRALIWQVAFNPPGDLLASVGGDGQLCVWDVAAATLLAQRPAHPLGATSLAFHPQGEWLATGGLDGSVQIWGVVR